MDHKPLNLYSSSMSAGELALCLHVKKVTNPESSLYINKYVSSLSAPQVPDKAQVTNPFLTPIQHLAKRTCDLRPASAFLAPRRSSSRLCNLNYQSHDLSYSACKDINKASANRSVTETRLASRSGSSVKVSSTVLHPRPNSRHQDYKTLTIVNQLSSSTNSTSHISAQAMAPYLLAPGGQYFSQLTVFRSPSRSNRASIRAAGRKDSTMKTVRSTGSSLESMSTGNVSRNASLPLTTFIDDEFEQAQLERDIQHHSKFPMQTGLCAQSMERAQSLLISLSRSKSKGTQGSKATVIDVADRDPTQESMDLLNAQAFDPLLTSITALSRSSSRNVFLESYVAEETVRRCLHGTGSNGSQILASNPGGEDCSSQASVLTTIHMDRVNEEDQDSPRIVATVLKKLVSELMQASRSPSPGPGVENNEHTKAPQSESSSPFSNTYSARDYVTHDDVISVFDPDDSLNFSKFKCLAKKFYGRISKEKLWSVAKEIDIIEEFDYKVDYLYSFLFNR